MLLRLYSRPDCHLCERLLEEIEPLLAPEVRIEIVDISEDAELTRRYGLRIPVLAAGAEEITGYPPDLPRVKRFLATQNR